MEIGASLTGTVHEPCVVGSTPDGMLTATISGERSGSAVTFVKVYNPTDRLRHPVIYRGTLSEDGSEIEGEWTIRANWSGKFNMIRSGPCLPSAEESRAEESTVPVGVGG